MWMPLCLLMCLAVIIMGVAAVDFCPEDGILYRIAVGDTVYGHVSSPTGESCALASLRILVPPPPSNLLLLTGGWQYLFGAVVEGALPAKVTFSIIALCDGIEVCRANIRYEVDLNASTDVPPTPTESSTTTTTTKTPLYPPCAASQDEYQLVILPGKPNIATLPTSAVQVFCPVGLQASITQPVIGSAAVLGPNSLQFVYASPDDEVEANITLPYEVKCDRKVICAGVMRIWLHENILRCPKDHLLYDVKPGARLNATLDTGASCGGALRARLRTRNAADIKFHDGVSFTFNASGKEEDVILNARLYCDDVTLCDVTFALIVTNEPRPSPTEAPHTDSTPAPTAAPIAICNEQFNFTVPVGTELRGKLHVEVDGCSLVTYHQSLYSSSKNLQLNIIGDFVYSAPAEEAVDKLPVDVSCVIKFWCRTYITITSYIDLTPTDSSTTPAPTTVPVPACANVYYYQTAPGVALSDSLNGMPGQDPCAYGRYFSLILPPSVGKLDLTPIGDFLYRPERNEGSCHFSFSMYCLNKLYCQGNAYILVSSERTLPPSGGKNGSSTPAPSPPSEVKNKQIKCRGTCNEKAWKTYPNPAIWDNSPGAGYARRDGHAVDEIQVAWMNNSIVITVYTIIGNLGVRFPTFEPLNRTVGKYFEPEDFEGVVQPSSLGFELSCLANQGSIGMGEDVWHWKTLGNGTGSGSVGALYNKGTSWYQKFGGKHIGCDTFVNSCIYAPLLTPALPNTTVAGRWEIDIDDCDATWTGTFPYASLEQLKNSDGNPVWYFVGDKQIKSTIISEAVRANSWIEPARSFDTQYEAHDVIFDLKQFIVVKKLATAPFSIDSEYFEYTENGDFAFGVNLLLHPYVTEDMKTSYAADRHVEGFKWITQEWVAPNAQHCITCKGIKSHCSAEGKFATSTYIGEFSSGDCPPGTSLVELRKGPAMDGSICSLNRMHVYNRSGFSVPKGCATWYQNLTIRGVSIGSGALPDALKRAFSYEGRVMLQLLMTDGTKHDVAMDLSMYVTRLSQDSYAAPGRLGVCRGSDYWPVLDPLGVSLPDRPFELSTATPGPLCIDMLSSTFGPSGWATVFLQLSGVLSSQLDVHTIVLKYKSTSVFLHYQDPATGAVAMPPKTLGHWWQHTHPFLSFRPLINRVKNDTLTIGPELNPSEVTDIPFAFAFIPGAINIDTNVEIILTATITTDVVSKSSFCRTIHVDPMMTQRSRYGPPRGADTELPNNIRKSALEVGVFAGLSIALTITGVVYMTMDNNRPLPRWVPRGKLIKDTVLAAVPAGLRPAKKQKRIVHKDMYDAMKSGRY
ncbi:hypothetical protein TcYC6_0110560 [Trypanosoma cruzi]|nr:hypothetical protein TcYC6_0110560 [Trypanosoma cruzi]